MNQFESIPNANKPHPSARFGIIALILSISPALFCLSSVILAISTDQIRYSIQAVVIQALLCVGILAALGGILLGIISLIRKETKKGLGIVSIAMGLLLGILLGVTMFFLFIVSFAAM